MAQEESMQEQMAQELDQYAVVGNPIEHTKSPLIHEMFAKQTTQAMHYGKIEAPLEGFEQRVREFFSHVNNKGLNVTVPFKEQAWSLCESRTERAELAGAVNTLFLNNKGDIAGDNTDGIGLVSDLKQHDISLKGKKILVIGAGGAVRGVLQPILSEQPDRVYICNRTVSKADVLVDLFKELGSLQSVSFESLAEECLNGGFDIVINGTSASLTGKLPPIPASAIGEQTVTYDMMYAKEDTVFNQWARTAGAAKMIDGLGMLVGQAAEAFYIWRGCRPETETVMLKLRSL